MKRYFFLFLSLSIGLVLISFTLKPTDNINSNTAANEGFEIPANVQSVIDKSCFGCHNSDSQSEKGKKKLQWDKLGDMKTYKLVGKLTDIADVVANSDMPPAKFLENKPEATPTAVEKKILADWAEKTAQSLSAE